MKTIRIESSANAAYKRLIKLKTPSRTRKEGVFLLEGERAVKELPQDWKVESLWISENYQGFIPEADAAYLLPEPLFQKAAETVHSQGILAVVYRKEMTLEEMPTAQGFWIILENLQDPGNAGTILRTADACAADGLILIKGTVDLYNSKVIRASMGSLFHIPFAEAETVEEAIDFIHEKGGQVIGTHLRTDLSYEDPDLKKPTAILIGNEGNGMTEKAAGACDQLVKIPMPGRAESLNASVAAGVMMYEVLRQRK